jgi:hypothetical protein
MKITTTFGILLLLAGWQAQAQTAACPVQPSLVKNMNSQLALDFLNTSGKVIASYQFSLSFYDSNGHAHPFPQHLNGNAALHTHGRRIAVWQTKLAQQFLFPYAQAFLEQVTFTDGSSWVDDGSHACSVTSVQE